MAVISDPPPNTLDTLSERIHRLALQQDAIMGRFDQLQTAIEKIALLEQRLPYEINPLKDRLQEETLRGQATRRDVDGMGKSLDTLRLEFLTFQATLAERQRSLMIAVSLVSAIATTVISQVLLALIGA